MSSRNMKAERSSINVGPALLPRESKAGAPSSSTTTMVRLVTFWTISYKRQNRDCQGYHCSLQNESITWTSNRALNQILDLCPDSIEKSLTKMVVPTRTHIPFRRDSGSVPNIHIEDSCLVPSVRTRNNVALTPNHLIRSTLQSKIFDARRWNISMYIYSFLILSLHCTKITKSNISLKVKSFPDRSSYISSIYLCYVHKARDAMQEGNTKLLKSNKVSYGNSELGTLRAGTARIIIDVVAYFTPDVIFQLRSTELSFATLLGSRKTCGSPLPSNSDKRGT
ncbi:hypothetical protein V1478_013171 [Vespula squamosa]|uniref:Uncharacterized protein n=1 Tax=Vespula squamosa TaxID=30214 RepID=A0ABD2AAM8_VESSQ